MDLKRLNRGLFSVMLVSAAVAGVGPFEKDLAARDLIARDCGCNMVDQGDSWAFYDCYSYNYCEDQKYSCALQFCQMEQSISDYYCGNADLFVSCSF